MFSVRWFLLLVLMKIISIFFFPAVTFANSGWLRYFRDATILNAYRRAYAVQDERLWLGTFGDGIMIHDGEKVKNLTVENTRSSRRVSDGLVSNYVTSLIIDQKKGRVWIGTNEGLSSCDLEGKNWIRFSSKDGLPSDVIRDLAIDEKDHLWVATPSGAARFDGENWETFNEKTGLLQDSIHSITARDGSVWIGTVGGSVSRYKDGSWKTVVGFF